ncbi:MAG TPA: hypothetical protein VFP34_07100 [Microlunatus sp.]|nr:hypothetical protein [Microlunatus sp.]
MRIELLVVADCPHEGSAGGLLRQALDDIGLGSESFTVRMVDTQSEADDLHFGGSPTFMVEGRDVFDDPGRPAAVACRFYSGAQLLPSLRDLRRALKEAAALARR